MPGPDDYSGAFASGIARELGRDEIVRRVAADRAAETTPDQAVESKRIADHFRVPPSVVDGHFDAFKQRYDAERTSQKLKATPALGQWLKDPLNAAVLEPDDHDTLGNIEKTVTFGSRIAQGIDNLQRMGFAAAEWAGEAVGSERVATVGREGRERNALEAQAHGEGTAFADAFRGPWEMARFITESVGEQVPIMAPMVAGGMLGGAVGGPLGVVIGAMAPVTLGIGSVQSAVKEKAPDASAPLAVFVGGSAVGAFDTILPNRIGTRLARTFGFDIAEQIAKRALLAPVKPGFARTVGGGIATEAITESLQEGIEEVFAAQGTGTPVDWTGLVSRLPEVAATGGIVGGVFTGASEATGRGVDRMRVARQQAAQQGAQVLTNLGEQVKASKLATRAPEAAEAFIAQATKNGPVEHVYLPIESFTEYYQSKQRDPAHVAAELTGDPEAYAKALASGEDLVVPTATYAVKIAAGEDAKFFVNEVRLGSPAAMNQRESEAFEQELEQDANAEAVEQPAAAETPPSTEPVRANLAAQLEASGFDRSTAENYANLHEAVVGSLVARSELPQDVVFDRYGLEVQRALAADVGLTGTPEGSSVAADGDVEAGNAGRGVGAAEAGRAAQRSGGSRPEGQRLSPSQERDLDLVDPLVESAVSAGFTGDPEQLRTALLERADLVREFDAEADAAGGTPVALLEAIAKAGGIGEDKGMPGEIAWLWEASTGHVTPKGFKKDGRLKASRTLATGGILGVKHVLRKTGGLSLDGIVEYLQEDGRFPHITDINALIDELTNIVQGVTKGPGAMSASRLGAVGDNWWEGLYQSGRGLFDEDANVDTLDTGEHQPRLPGAENVREQEIATPEFEAPFTLTGEVSKRKGKQESLFQSDFLGRITWGKENRQFKIELFENADRSTFLHESGHFYLEVLGDLSDLLGMGDPTTLSPTQKQLLADYGAILQWLGVDNRSEITREHHEKFADGFLTYLQEGKAPSRGMRRAFANFRTWLIGIFGARGSGVRVNPEIRAIFDRLVATDQAIEEAAADEQIQPLFIDVPPGYTPEQFEAYKEKVQAAAHAARNEVDQQLQQELAREASAAWLQERGEVHAQVTAETYQQPVYRAIAAITKGTHPDGTSLVDGQDPEPMKFAKAPLEALVGKEGLRAFQKPYLYTVDGGAHPDTVAELFGFSSGDALVKAISSAVPMEQAIETETDARMRAKHGTLDGPGILEAARGAIHQTRFDVVAEELKVLSGQATVKRATLPPGEVFTRAATTRIASMKVRDVRPGQFMVAAKRAGRVAFEKLAAGDQVGAVTAKQQELFALALFREATNVRDTVERRVRALRKFESGSTRERIGKAGGDYLEQIDALLTQYEVGKVTLRQLDRRTSLRSFVAQQERLGLPVDMPERVLDDARQQNYQELTVEAFTDVHDAVQHIAHLARLKNKLLKSAAKRAFDEEVDAMRTSMAEHATKGAAKKIEMRLPQDRLARRVSAWFGGHRKLHNFLRQMDGWQDGGVMWEAVQRPVNDAANAEAVRVAKETEAGTALYMNAFAGRESELYRKRFIPALNDSMTLMGRVAVALNWGNAQNRQRVTGGGLGQRGPMTPQQVDAILDTLTAQDWQFVQGVWDWFESFRPEIGAKEKRVKGVEPEWVEPTPVVTKFGTLRGGYYPIAYEGQASAKVSNDLDASFADSLKAASYVAATTKRGHLKARQEKVSEPLRLDFGVITEHVAQVVHDLTHHEMLIDVGRLLGKHGVADAIVEHYGDVAYEQIKGAIFDVANGQQLTPGWFQPINYARQGGVVASLGWSAMTSALQPFQITNGMVRVGPTWVMKGVAKWTRNAVAMQSTVGWIQDRSDFMKMRGRTQLREINELRNRVGLGGGRVSGWMHDALFKLGVDQSHMPAIADSYFYLIQKAQQIADVPVWLGAYEKAMADGANDDARAVALADQAVIDSQGSGHTKDLAAVERQPFLKLLTTFYSYQNLVLNQSREVVGRTDFKSPQQLARMTIDALLLLMVPSMVYTVIHSAVSGDDDDLSAGAFLRQQVGDLLGLFIGTRELSGMVQGYDYQGPAGMRWASAVYRAGTQAMQGELDPAFWRALNQAGGIFFHYPALQVQRTTEGVLALMEGKATNPLVVFTGPPREAAR